MGSFSGDREPVELLAEDFLARRRRGENPTIQEYTEKHPELAEEIRDIFPTLLIMEDVDPGTEELRASTADTVTDRPSAKPHRVGDYRILREIGRGAMGVVYEAEQQSLGRRVALKILPKQLAADSRALVRFRREARAAARLHHTNIVPVFEVGQDGDTLFYAMQYIQGQSLDKVLHELRHLRNSEVPVIFNVGDIEARTVALSLCRGRFRATESRTAEKLEDPAETEEPRLQITADADMSAQEGSGGTAVPPLVEPFGGLSGVHPRLPAYFLGVAKICQQAASALSYAHERNTVHRDIKPSNLLLDSNGVLWVADFGLAKFEDDGHTRPGDLLGTLRYMSPERFRGQCDARADIYALGATLYELLVLRPAFESTNHLELLDQISNLPPRSTRAIDPKVPLDLETIAMKAMDKDPVNRYQSARELGEDLRRFVQDEPIRARKPLLAERFVRWGRKNRAVATLTVTTFVVLLALALVSVAFAIHFGKAKKQVEKSLQEAQQAREMARRNQYFSDMYAADFAWQSSDTLLVDRLLGRYRKQEDQADLRGFEWYYLWRDRRITPVRRMQELPGHAVRLAVTADGTCLAVSSGYGTTITLWDLRTNSKIDEFGQHDPAKLTQTPVAISSNGYTLAYPSFDGSEVLLRNLREKTAKQIPLGSGKQLTFAVFSPAGPTLATANDDNGVRLWNTGSGDLIVELKQHEARVRSLAFSVNGQYLASGSEDGQITIWSVADHQPRVHFKGHQRRVNSLAFSPDGKHLASASSDRNVRIWDAGSGQLVYSPPMFADEARVIGYSPKGTFLAAAGRDHVIRLWDATTYADCGAIRNFNGTHAFSFLSEEKLAFGGSKNIAICEIQRLLPEHVKVSDGSIESLFVTRTNNGKVFVGAVSRTRGSLRIWTANQAALSECQAITPDFQPGCVAATQGGLIAIGEANGRQLAIYDLSQMKFSQRLQTKIAAGIQVIAISKSGTRLAVGCSDGRIAIWRLNQKSRFTPMERAEFVAHSEAVECMAFDSSGRMLASGSRDKHVKTWNVDSGVLVRDLGEEEKWVVSVAFSPNGARLATGYFSREIKIRHWPTGKPDCTLVGHYMNGTHVSFLRDGRTLVSAGTDRLIKLWDLETQQERFNLRGGESIFESLAISPDEKLIAAGTRDGMIRVFRAATETEVNDEL
jgi:WD40 repeat protein/serine/threonine protein kinase